MHARMDHRTGPSDTRVTPVLRQIADTDIHAVEARKPGVAGSQRLGPERLRLLDDRGQRRIGD